MAGNDPATLLGNPADKNADGDEYYSPAGTPRRLVVDIKTWRGIAFRYLAEPKRPHVVQLQTYVMLRNAAGGLLLYVDRDGENATRQFHVQRDDDTVRRAARVITRTAAGPEPAPPAGRAVNCGLQ